jgi:hypothetical protein
VQELTSGLGRFGVEGFGSHTIRHTQDEKLIWRSPTVHRACHLHKIQQTQEENDHNFSGIRTHESSNERPQNYALDRPVYFTICSLYVISGFRREVDEIWALLSYYAAYNGNYLSKFRDNILVPSSRVKILNFENETDRMFRNFDK